MNKFCFRLIFSKPLGFLIPVAEITRAQRKPGQQPAAAPLTLSPTEPFSWSLKRLVLSVLLAGVPGWAAAEILVDPTTPAGSTKVINAGNGVPVIEIANPNAKGLSHNRFSEFDVQQPGVIFNNSRVNGVSQLGGAVLLNPNLQRTATAILTEVTGNKPSSLAGTLEVFGDKADLLIANLKYVFGNGTDNQPGTRAKGYILMGSETLPVHPELLLKRANEKLDSRGLQFDAKFIAVKDVAHKQQSETGSGTSGSENIQRTNRIWEAQQKNVISHEAAAFLDQVESKAAHRLKTEPVFFGEDHSEPNARLVIEELIARKNVSRLLLEREPVKDFIDPVQLKYLNDELAKYGYSSVDDFLSNFKPGDKESPLYKKIQNAVVTASETVWGPLDAQLITAAVNAGVNIDFVDGGRNPNVDERNEFILRNNYISEKINSDPKYSAAGVVGLFGSEHLRVRVGDGGQIIPALQQMVELHESNIFDTLSVFKDSQTGEEFFDWGVLGANTRQSAEMSNSSPFVVRRKQSSSESNEMESTYSNSDIRRRVIINAAGRNADSVIQKITGKYPSSSIVFDALKDGGLKYVSGADDDRLENRRVKAYIVAGSEGLPINFPTLLEHAKKKLSPSDLNVTIKHIAISENEAPQASRVGSLNKPVGMTDNRTNALPASTVVKSQEQVVAGGLVGKTTPSAIDQATAVPVKAGPSEESDFDVFRDQGIINADTAKFLDKARKEIGKQLATGPVLIGEQNSELNAPLLISQLISDRAVKKLVVELPPLDDQLKKIQGGTELLKAIRKQGYKSGEDFLNNAPLVNRDGSTNKTLQLLLEAITYNGDPAKQNRSVSGDLVREAVLAGVKVHYVAQPTEAGKAPASINSRNKYMAQKIKKLGGLDAPGTVGLFDAEQLKQQLKGTGIKPGLQKRIGLAESRTYDLSPAVSTAERGGIVARWDELGRDTQVSVPERISSLFPFELDTSKKPSFFGGKRYYKATSAEPSQTAATRF